MDSFNFEIVLNYGMEQLSIKPPASYNSLIDVVKERFDLALINRLVYFEDDEEIKITNDSDYLTMFDFVENNKLKEIEILIKSDEEKVKKRKKSMRKLSKSTKTVAKNIEKIQDGCINGKYIFNLFQMNMTVIMKLI